MVGEPPGRPTGTGRGARRPADTPPPADTPRNVRRRSATAKRPCCWICASGGSNSTRSASRLHRREAVLAAAEQKLAARVAELRSLQKKLEALDAARKQKDNAGWQGLVKMYEAMKPRDAATIFNDLRCRCCCRCSTA